jgi:hypothetical protein
MPTFEATYTIVHTVLIDASTHSEATDIAEDLDTQEILKRQKIGSSTSNQYSVDLDQVINMEEE